jgi:hypothetical protein
MGGLASPATGAGDDLVPAGVGAHGAGSAEGGPLGHGHGGGGHDVPGSGGGSHGSQGTGSGDPHGDPTPPDGHDPLGGRDPHDPHDPHDADNPGDPPQHIPPEDIPPLLHRETPYETGGIQPDYVGEQYPDGHFKFLGSNGVTYLDDVARQDFRITIHDGHVYDARGNLFDTSNGVSAFGPSNGGRAIFVMDENGNLFASTYQHAGDFHHSSFFSGGDVAAAGELVVKDGKIEIVTDRSGHYLPSNSRTQQMLDQLASQGIDMRDVIVDLFIPGGN